LIFSENVVSLHPEKIKNMISKEEHLMLHAEALFAERGFDGTSIRDISNKAKVNVSMISYYFGSKEKLFEKIFEVRMSESLSFSKDILANETLNAWEKLCIIISRYVQRVRTLKTFYLILQREQLRNANTRISTMISKSKQGFLRIYAELLESGYESGIFTRKPRLEFLHSTVSGTVFTALNLLPMYQSYLEAGPDYEEQYFADLNTHLSSILKHLLGHEENK